MVYWLRYSNVLAGMFTFGVSSSDFICPNQPSVTGGCNPFSLFLSLLRYTLLLTAPASPEPFNRDVYGSYMQEL